MRSFKKNKPLLLMLVASLFLMGMDNGEEGTDGLAKLVEQQKQLKARIETLKQEQDYLLFQKAMYASDSKYLVINIAARTGQLKCKNRILKDFHFTSAGHDNLLKQGAITLTRKIEDTKKRRSLIFGSSLVLLDKQTPATRREPSVPRIYLSKKDFRSVFYSIENGAMSYLMQ